MTSSSGPYAAAHRGLSAEHPENTFAAFEAAIDAGFPAIELDARLTRDHEVVVLHDAGVERTTNGRGRVADMSYDELRGYDTSAGPVPRLDDVFARLEDWPGQWIVECKAHRAAVQVLDLARHHRVHRRLVLSSTDPRALHQAIGHDPDVERALIVMGPVDDLDVGEAVEAECTWIHADQVHLGLPHIERVRGSDLRLGAWTVNDPVRARALVRSGVECVITDQRLVLDELRGAA